MQAQGLHTVMNDVASMLDGMLSAASQSPKREPMSDLEAFAQTDPLLAQLQKDFIDARALRIQAQKEYGQDNPMTDMAGLSEDSAWCAMQTRFLEVRADRACAKKAQDILLEERLEAEREERRAREEQTLKFYRQMQVYNRVQEKRPSAAEILFFYLLLMISPRSLFDCNPPTQRFNALAA